MKAPSFSKRKPLRGMEAAVLYIETVPLLMRFIKTRMRARRGPGLTVPQFRALAFLGRNPDSSLTEIAEFIGITKPSASVILHALVRKKLALRCISPTDRRGLLVSLSPEGRTLYRQARAATLADIRNVLVKMPPDLLLAMKPVFACLRQSFEETMKKRSENETRNLS